MHRTDATNGASEAMIMKVGTRVSHTTGAEGIFLGNAKEDGCSSVFNLSNGSTQIWPNVGFSMIEVETPVTCVYVVNPAKVGVWRIAGGVVLANLIVGVIVSVIYVLLH